MKITILPCLRSQPSRRVHGERTRADEVRHSQHLQSRSSHLRNNCRRRIKEKLAGCSNMTIWRLRRDGKLPKPKKLGNRNVTLEDDIDRAMELLVVGA